MSANRPTLGTLMRSMRQRLGWTINTMSEKSGIPVSTLSKIEHDRLSLTYDKLQIMADRLGMKISEFFSDSVGTAPPEDSRKFTARRSFGDLDKALRVNTANYDHYYLCTELRFKRMIPVILRVRAKSEKEFGALVQHSGEEFIYVLEGSVEVHTAFYDPVILEAGRSMYIDSDMGHAYLAAPGCDEAVILATMAGPGEDDHMRSLLDLHDPDTLPPR